MVKYLFEFSVEGTKYHRCDFENGFCDLIQMSNSVLSRWIRTVNAPGLQHGHKGNTSGMTLNFELLNTYISCTYISSSLLFFSCRTFLGSSTLWRKQNHSRSNQSRLPAQSDLPGYKNSFVKVCWEMQTQYHHSSSVVFFLCRWVSTIMLPLNMDIFRSLSRIMCRVRWQRCGKTQHCHSWKHGRGRWLCSPAITAFRCVTFII